MLDEFAKAALQGELASQTQESYWSDFKILSERCYLIAEAMIKERKKYNYFNGKIELPPPNDTEIVIKP